MMSNQTQSAATGNSWSKQWGRRLAGGIMLFLLLGAQSVSWAQGRGPHDQDGNADSIDLSRSLERLTDAASEMIPAFVRTIESPLGIYFETIAFYLAWLIMLMFFLKMLRGASNDPEDLFWVLARVSVCFALLGYCGDTNGDGIRGDLVNRLGQMGNSIAYGDHTRDVGASFLQRQVKAQQTAFSNNYVAFVENKFMYRINNEDRLVRYPDDDNKGFQTLSAIYSGNDSLATVTEKFNPNGWNMSNLFQFLNFGRGLVEFGDLFLLILQGFLVAAIRLCAPFMIAVAIDREHAKRISIPFAWGAIVVTLILPVVSQIIRFFAYTVANLAMDARSAKPYFKYDPTTAKVIAMGSPEYMIIICALLMIIIGLCMFASTWISYKLSQGQTFEAVSGAVSGWMGAIISTGIASYSTAASAAINRQAAETQNTGQARAEGVTAGSSLSASNIGAQAQMASSIALSRSQTNAETGGYGVTAWSANQKASAQQEKLETEQLGGVMANDIEQDAKVSSGAVTAQSKLDDVPTDVLGPLSSIGAMVDNSARKAGDRHFGNSRGNQQDGWDETLQRGEGSGGGIIPGTERPFVPLKVGEIGKGGRDTYQPANRGNFSVAAQGQDIKDAFRQKFGREMPANVGQRDVHNRVGYDHRNAMDVPIDPNSKEGKWLRGYLQQNGIPYNAFKGAQTSARTGKTVSTGDHVHVGASSHNSGGRTWAIGTTLPAYRTPAGAAKILSDNGGDTRSLVRPARDAMIGLENTTREATASAQASRVRAESSINAGRTFTNREMSINNSEAGARIAIAQRAGSERESVARYQRDQSVRSNETLYHGQVGDPKAPAGSFERMGAIEIRRNAASDAARMQAMSQFVGGVGSTIASQVQGVFTQFNRY